MQDGDLNEDLTTQIRLLEDLCHNPRIPQENYDFISLIYLACNMHVFGMFGFRIKGVLVFLPQEKQKPKKTYKTCKRNAYRKAWKK